MSQLIDASDRWANGNPLLLLVLAAGVLGAALSISLQAAAGLFMGLLAALIAGYAILVHPFVILLFLAAYTPFEDFILKWLPLSGSAFAYVRLFGELLVYATFARVVFGRLFTGKRVRLSKADLFLVLFVASAMLSILVNNAAWIPGIINIRALLRYLALFYIVLNLDLSEAQSQTLMGTVAVAAIIEAVIGLLQYAGGNAVMAFFSPPSGIQAEVGDVAVSTFSNLLKLGAVGGTIGKPAAMGLFLIVGTIALLALHSYRKISTSLLAAACLLVFAGILVTFKRGELFLWVGAIALYMIFRLRPKDQTYISVLAGIAIMLILLTIILAIGGEGDFVSPKQERLSIVEHFQQLFTSAYWKRNFQSSRGWFLSEVGPYALRDGGLLGYSPDWLLARETLANRQPDFKRLVRFRVFEDVYWVAMLIYYGWLGLGFFVLFLIQSIRKGFRALSRGGFEGVVAAAFLTLAFVTIPAAFLERVFELRTYSLYLWMFAGLAIRALYDASGQSRSAGRDRVGDVKNAAGQFSD